MLAYFFRNGIQIHLVIVLAKESMRPQLFYSRPLRHVADQLIQLTDTVGVALDEGVNKLTGVALSRRNFVVMIFAIIFRRPVELDDVLH